MKRKIKNKLGINFNRERQKDKTTTDKRSSVMSKIRSRGTKFETDFIDELSRMVKEKFETHVKDIRGKPDIVFRGKKVCVFLDSNFWHGWQYPRWKHLLKNDFWRNKIEKNRLRDRNTTQYLRREGWAVIRIWEHSIKNDIGVALRKIMDGVANG